MVDTERGFELLASLGLTATSTRFRGEKAASKSGMSSLIKPKCENTKVLPAL